MFKRLWCVAPLILCTFFFSPAAPGAGGVVWQLNLTKTPRNYQLQSTHLVRDGKGQLVLEADTRHLKSEWNSCLSIPAGLLKTGKDYTITVDYQVIDRSGPDNYFYAFVRSDRLDGGGSTFLFHQIKGGAGMLIRGCTRTVISHFNLDWDWQIDPLASVGRILKIGPGTSYFEMRFETAAPMDPKRWVTMNPLDEKLRVPGTGQEFGDFGPKKIDSLDAQTVRVWPSWPVPAKVGQLYLLRHYTFEKHAIVIGSNSHLSLQYVTIFSFPGIGFIAGGDLHHLELLHCSITYPAGGRRCITTTADGFHVDQSQGFIRLEDCDFGYMGDDCVNIHDNIHSGVKRLDAHTLLAENIVPWRSPYNPGDMVEIRNGDYSPAGFTGKVQTVKNDYKNNTVTLVFEQPLPGQIVSDAILFNHRYGSRNCIIRNCYFHENRARGVLCNTADWLVEGNRFYHNQHSAMLLIADMGSSWSEGFGARNVIVRHNTFDSSNCLGVGEGATQKVVCGGNLIRP